MFVLLRGMASIFYQILYMSILASVISLVILLIQKIINRRVSPKCNYLIWLVFIFILIFPISIPSKLSVYNYVDISNVKIVDDGYVGKIWNCSNILNTNERVKFNSFYNNTKLLGGNLKILFPDILLVISLLNIFKTIVTYYLSVKRFGNKQVKDERIVNIFNECKKEMGIKRNIKLVNQNIADSPAIIGVFNVKVLYTEKLNSFDDTSLKNMFLHELSHYKRKDNYMNFLILVLTALYWFNPIIKNSFKNIKRDMEFATDELAIKNMDIDETRNYCKTIIDAEESRSCNVSPVLGFAGELEYVAKRIDLISLKSKFKRFSKIISTCTVFIILLICLIFYPTSYGITNSPKLYLQSENGNIIEIKNNWQNIIQVDKNSNLKLIVKNAGVNNYIYFNSTNLADTNNQDKETTILDNEITCFEIGEYMYNFMVVNSKNKTFDYSIKVIVK